MHTDRQTNKHAVIKMLLGLSQRCELSEHDMRGALESSAVFRKESNGKIGKKYKNR